MVDVAWSSVRCSDAWEAAEELLRPQPLVAWPNNHAEGICRTAPALHTTLQAVPEPAHSRSCSDAHHRRDSQILNDALRLVVSARRNDSGGEQESLNLNVIREQGGVDLVGLLFGFACRSWTVRSLEARHLLDTEAARRDQRHQRHGALVVEAHLKKCRKDQSAVRQTQRQVVGQRTDLRG